MSVTTQTQSVVRSSVSLLTIMASAIVAISLSAGEADAQGGAFRKGAVKTENGAAARSRGFVSNGEGSGGVRRGGFASDGQGNGAAGRGGCANGASGSGCRGRAAAWNDDGSFSGRSGAEYSGDNGSFSSRRAFDRDADGDWTGSASTDASGASGSYSGGASVDGGVYSRDGVYTGDEGQTASVQSSYERGVGGSRSVTCTDASGAAVTCP